MKRRIINYILIMMILLVGFSGIPKSYASEVELKINNKTVTYRGTNIAVTIPSEYVKPETEFRGVWVTPIVSDNLAKFISVEQYKAEITEVLDIMEYYNLNALIFHVRPFNDALYRSKLNPWSSYLVGFGVDPGWDPLPWIIEETHKRGIEFHAWLNPYRITNNQAGDPATVAHKYRNYPRNAASNPENILVNSNGDRAILNPGEPAVREFLIETVLELMENYDIDAIHFDDYFYIDGIDDSHTRAKYNTQGLSVADWRREQIDIFIHDLSVAMREFNQRNNRYVQLGISPTGIYKNGGSGFAYGGQDRYDSNGNFITNGSNTGGQEHYASYLYSNTKKWVDNEWIDYIIPQTYWAFTHPSAAYADVVDWWAKVVRYKKVNLYTGMGIYMSTSGGNYSWGLNVDEAAMQVLYNTKHEHVRGTSIFSYTELKYAYFNDLRGNSNRIRTKNGLEKLRQYWNSPSIMPELRTYNSVYLNKVTNLQALITEKGVDISWNKIPEASKYAIYRSSTPNFTVNELIAVVGHDSETSRVHYIDKDLTVESYYKVVPISKTNTLGEESTIQASFYNQNEIGEIKPRIISIGYPGEQFTLVFDKLAGVNDVTYWLEYSHDLLNWNLLNIPLVDLGTYYGADLQFPFSRERLYIKVSAENEDGKSAAVIEVDYKEVPKLLPINRISISGVPKAGTYVEAFWNAINIDFYQDIQYIIEYSYDKVNFFETEPDYYIDNRNRIRYRLYIPNKDTVYLRIKLVHEFSGQIVIGTPIVVSITRNPVLDHFEVFLRRYQNQVENILR